MPDQLDNLFSRLGGIIRPPILGIDSGTASTRVTSARKRGKVYSQATAVATHIPTDTILEFGTAAQNISGKTKTDVAVTLPIEHGMIADFETSEEFFSFMLKQGLKSAGGLRLGTKVVGGIPTASSNVEREAYRDVLRSAGARSVLLIEEPLAAAVGLRLPIFNPQGVVIADIGAGTTDVALISLGGIIASERSSVAGDSFDKSIQNYLHQEFGLDIGNHGATKVKHSTISLEANEVREGYVSGRDVASGLPRTITVTSQDVRKAISASLEQIVSVIRDVLEQVPAEMIDDVSDQGVVVTGGSAVIPGLKNDLESSLELPIIIADDPARSVIRGINYVISDRDRFASLLIHEEEPISLSIEQ